jgi:hypothetical protein
VGGGAGVLSRRVGGHAIVGRVKKLEHLSVKKHREGGGAPFWTLRRFRRSWAQGGGAEARRASQRPPPRPRRAESAATASACGAAPPPATRRAKRLRRLKTKWIPFYRFQFRSIESSRFQLFFFFFFFLRGVCGSEGSGRRVLKIESIRRLALAPAGALKKSMSWPDNFGRGGYGWCGPTTRSSTCGVKNKSTRSKRTINEHKRIHSPALHLNLVFK